MDGAGRGESKVGQSPGPAGEWLGVAAALFTLMAWTVAPLFIKYLTGYIDLWTSNGWRYAIGALVWAPALVLLLWRGVVPQRIWRAALIPTLFNAAGQVCFVQAFYDTGAAMVTFGLRVQIVCVALAAAVMFPGERRLVRSPGFALSAVLVLGGTIAVGALSPDLAGAVAGSSHPVRGVVLAVLAGVFFGGYAISVRACMDGIGPVASFAVISQYTAAVMVALMLLLGERSGLTALDLSPRLMLFLALSAVLAIAFGHVAYYMGIKRLGVSLTAGIVQLQPFCVAAVSVPLLGEVLTPGQWLGGGLAVCGAMLMLMTQHRLRMQSRRARLRGQAGPCAASDAGPVEDEPRDEMPVDAAAVTLASSCPSDSDDVAAAGNRRN